MKVKVIKCDNCKKQTDDIYSEVGWIEIPFSGDSISGNSISVTGGRRKSGHPITFRYIRMNGLTHFCCFECLLDYLYLKDENFNGEYTIDTKLNSIEDSGIRNKLKEITTKIINYIGEK